MICFRWLTITYRLYVRFRPAEAIPAVEPVPLSREFPVAQPGRTGFMISLFNIHNLGISPIFQ